MPDEEGTSPKPETAEPPHRAHASAGRRRSLLVAGAVVLALIVLVVVPGYFAIQPSFMARYSYLNVEYTTWSQSAHKDVPCQSCHIAPGILDQAGYDARMLGAFYVSLVLVVIAAGISFVRGKEDRKALAEEGVTPVTENAAK